MNITDAEYEYLTNRIQTISSELSQLLTDRNNFLGRIGEKFAGYAISHVLWKLGYVVDLTYHPRSYFFIPHYGAGRQGIEGIDYLIKITDDNEHRFNVFIEVKNWGHYNITPDMFDTEILQRYLDADPTHQHIWIVTMNTRNIDDIRERCNENNIYILPLSHHITLESINQNDLMKNVYKTFIDVFDELICRLVPEDAYPDMDREIEQMDSTGGVIQDLIMGVSYNIIQERYHVSRNYIKRLNSYIKSFHIPLPDRRKKDWRVQWEIQG